MGSGRWSDDGYYKSRSIRQQKGIDDFDYSNKNKDVNEGLDPRRINKKVLKVLESRDSKEHPNSRAIVVSLDVTGSNIARAREAQKALPALMNLLTKYEPDPQISIAANDDYLVVGRRCFQVSEFESDNRIDDWLRLLLLTGDGGGNGRESYDHVLYFAARKTAMDCLEKRQQKGFLFMYADENFPYSLPPKEVQETFGDGIEREIPIEDLVKEVKEKFNTWVLWPAGGYTDARKRSIQLFGYDSVVTLQEPSLICEMIGTLVGAANGKVTVEDAERDLVAAGVPKEAARTLVNSAAPVIAAGRKFRFGREDSATA